MQSIPGFVDLVQLPYKITRFLCPDTITSRPLLRNYLQSRRIDKKLKENDVCVCVN